MASFVPMMVSSAELKLQEYLAGGVSFISLILRVPLRFDGLMTYLIRRIIEQHTPDLLDS